MGATPFVFFIIPICFDRWLSMHLKSSLYVTTFAAKRARAGLAASSTNPRNGFCDECDDIE